MRARTQFVVCAFAALAATARLSAQAPEVSKPLPLKFSGPPTTQLITATDLMTRLYIFADDSMAGRAYGSLGGARGTAYIERELRRLGLTPAGDSGGFFQNLPAPRTLLKATAPPARNVIAILPGSDPALKGQYVAIGAHSDHVGFNRAPADHDSLRVYNQLVRPQGAESPPPQNVINRDVVRGMRASTDSLHKLHPARRDSIYNGADDDGSGSVSLLELAEAFAKGDIKPKRSIIFVWHAGEEGGMLGSTFFTDRPTIPRDSIVAQLNIDMIGRGGESDQTGTTKEGNYRVGGPGYLQLIGSRRLSTELGNVVEAVNSEKHLGLKFDYALDADGHPQQIYCRSDHYSYARYGIPIVFLTTGGHADYHQVTDEPQYIDYDHMAHVAHLVFETALRIADLDHRLVVDKPKPKPKDACKQ